MSLGTSGRSPRKVTTPSSPRPDASCSRDRVRSWAAASSMASGSPSSRWQIAATARALSGVRANPGTTAAARSANSARAGYRTGSVLSGSLAGGTGSGGSVHTVSPRMPSGCWLVHSTDSPGADRSSSSTSAAQASSTCSQLSSTSSSSRSARCSASSCGVGTWAADRTDSAWATAYPTSEPSVSSARSTCRTPSAKTRRSSPATRTATRVLPVPPAPVSVTRRLPESSRLTCATSRWRPTKLVNSATRWPVGRRGTPCLLSISARILVDAW